MGGPCCRIPLRDAASDERLLRLRQWLWSLDQDRGLPPPADSPVWDWHPIGAYRSWEFGLRGVWLHPDNQDLRPFSLGVSKMEDESDIADDAGFTDWSGWTVTADDLRNEVAEERREWLAKVGFYPAQALDLEAHCNGAVDHRILGTVALGLAEQCDGLVDLNGAITPPRREPPLGPGDSPTVQDARADAALWPPLESVHAFVSQLPGHVYERYYTTASGRRWVSHVMDLTALRAWLQHPSYYMIK
jgi:hypothetical protein